MNWDFTHLLEFETSLILSDCDCVISSHDKTNALLIGREDVHTTRHITNTNQSEILRAVVVTIPHLCLSCWLHKDEQMTSFHVCFIVWYIGTNELWLRNVMWYFVADMSLLKNHYTQSTSADLVAKITISEGSPRFINHNLGVMWNTHLTCFWLEENGHLKA